MGKREKLIEFLLKPPLWFDIPVWISGVAGIAGSNVLYFLGLGLCDWAIPVHLFMLVFVILSVYSVLTIIGIPERAKDNTRVKQFFSSYNTRAFVYATGSVVFNVCYVVFGILIAAMEHSAWLGVLVGCHIFLVLPRLEVLFTAKIKGKKENEDAERQRIRAYTNGGLLLVMLAFAIIPVIRMTILDRNSYRYFVSAATYAASLAAYTFVKLGIAIYNLKKAHRQDDVSLIAVKNISFADALISLFVLQAMMLKELDTNMSKFSRVMNPALGGVIVAVILGLGTYMLVSGVKKQKKLAAERQAADEKLAAASVEDNDELDAKAE